MKQLAYLFAIIWVLIFIAFNVQVQATEVLVPKGYYFNSGSFTTSTGKAVPSISYYIPGDFKKCEKLMKAYSDVTNCGSCSLFPLPGAYVVNNWKEY